MYDMNGKQFLKVRSFVRKTIGVIKRPGELDFKLKMPEKIPSKQKHVHNCKQGAIRAVRFNVEGSYCLTCGSDKTVKLWNPSRMLLLKTYPGHGYEVLDAQSSSDNSQICSGGMDKTVMVFDVASGKCLRKYRAHAGTVNCVKYNEDSSLVLSGSIDCSVKIWDQKSRKLEPIQVLDEAKDSITCLQVSDHEILTGSADGRIRRYDLRMGKLYADMIGKDVTSVTLTADGQCVLTSTLDSSVRLMDKDTGEMLNEYKGHVNTDYKLDSCLNNKDTHILSGSEDGFVYIWDLIEAKQVGKLKHENQKVVHSLSHHPTQNCLLTAAGDKVYMWTCQDDPDDDQDT